jgi:hypothetical protein
MHTATQFIEEGGGDELLEGRQSEFRMDSSSEFEFNAIEGYSDRVQRASTSVY